MNKPQDLKLAQVASRSIGDILLDANRISAGDLDRILHHQRTQHVAFGDAGIALKILTKEDIDFALRKQFDYAYLSECEPTISTSMVAAYKPFSRVGENLRAVRAQLMLRWFGAAPQRRLMAVASPGQGDGRSFIAGNLAIVFAQQGERTLLIDGDMRSNSERGLQSLFQLGRGAGLSNILAGRAGLEAARPVPGLPGLAVLRAGAAPPNPQELLGRTVFGDLLRDAASEFDVVLIDTPCGGRFADVDLIAARAGAALMVTRANHTLAADAAALGRRLQGGGVTLVGAVLNDS